MARLFLSQPMIEALFNLALCGVVLASEQALGGDARLPEGEHREGSVAIVLPARNEERAIERSVRTLLDAAAHYGTARLVVVDDGSTDATSQRLAVLAATHPHRDRLTVVRLDEALPEGWMGKPRACWAGAQHPTARAARWLLFVDADTASDPTLIGRLVAAAEKHHAALVSLFPYQELVTLAERLTMPHIFYILGTLFPWRQVNDPDSPLAIANGQCILIRRDTYDAVGGHAAVRDAIAEDQALAARLKQAGHRLYIADGRTVMRTRMYTSWAELWEGWTKNAYLGLGDRGWALGLVALFGLLGGLLPFIALPWRWRHGGPRQAWPWLLTVTVLLRNRFRLMDEIGLPRRYAVATPLSAVLCTAIALGAWWKIVSGQGVTWKGRRYAKR